MPVIAVVNRKGGSGKSTLAAHMAAWCALQGSSVMLGDVDRQQSARAWLKRRDPALLACDVSRATGRSRIAHKANANAAPVPASKTALWASGHLQVARHDRGVLR